MTKHVVIVEDSEGNLTVESECQIKTQSSKMTIISNGKQPVTIDPWTRIEIYAENGTHIRSINRGNNRPTHLK